MNLLEAIKDEQLGIREWLTGEPDGDLSSWLPWMVAMRCLIGLPVHRKYHDLVRECTGRDAKKLPKEGFKTALFLTGRRCGKSRVAAVLSAYAAAIEGKEKSLAAGEQAILPIICPSKHQASIVHGYLRSLFDVGLLKGQVTDETVERGFILKNGVNVQILAGDYRTCRGFSLPCGACLDESAFFGVEDTGASKVRTLEELIRAIKPALAAAGGRLIAITSPYARRGWTYTTWKKNWGNDNGKTLVWMSPSRTMNPTLPQSVVDDALEEDRAAAQSEFLGMWRDDVATFLDRGVIESLVVKGRTELLPPSGEHCYRKSLVFNPLATTRAPTGVPYHAFVDISGGRSDASALAIAHREVLPDGRFGRKVVLALVRNVKAPHSPQAVIRDFADICRQWHVGRVCGDSYAAEFCSGCFEANGISFVRSEKNRSELYLEMIPRFTSGEVELLDNELLINQFANLERRTRSGGRDLIDHAPGAHDDLANAAAGAIELASKKLIRVGAL